MEEQFDILDCRGIRTGERITRSEAHRTGAWHGAFHCLIAFARAGRVWALFQKRATTKAIAPGRFDVSVGGHYAAGEDAAAAGPREIREELGLAVDFAELVPLGRRVFVHCFTPGMQEYEFQDVYLLPRRVDSEELALQREELDGVLLLEAEEGIALFSGRKQQAAGDFLSPDGAAARIAVTAAEFVPCPDAYYLKLLVLARSYFRGEREALAI